MKWLHKYLKYHPSVEAFIQKTQPFAHLTLTQEALLIIGSIYKEHKPLFIVKENEQKALDLVAMIQKIASDVKVVFYNQEESLRVEAISQSDVMRADRMSALAQLLNHDYDVCITHAIAAVRPISKPEVLTDRILKLAVGMDYDPQQLIHDLVNLGYERVKFVEKPFNFSARGGILDVFSVQEDYPIRIEFFDTEIESIRTFDLESQRSITALESATILFSSDVLLTASQKARLLKELKNQQEIYKNKENLVHELSIVAENIAQGFYEPSMLPLLGALDDMGTIFDYVLDADGFLSPYERVEVSLKQFTEDSLQFLEERYVMEAMVLDGRVLDNLWEKVEQQRLTALYDFQAEGSLVLPWHQAEVVADTLTNMIKILEKASLNQMIVIALNDDRMEPVINALVDHKVSYKIMGDTLQGTGLYLDYSEISSGIVFDDIHVTVYTSKELFQYEQKRYRYDNKFLQAESLNHLQDLNVGDYVVHRQYGIGRYQGIMTKEVDGIHKDFMELVYRDNDELFVPIEQVSLVRKYLSSEAVAVKLSKLGSSAWQKSKERIKEDVKEVADKLVKLYSERMDSEGFAFSPDTDYQKEFEASFPYPLTPDQEVAIREIKHDMERAIPMDRLLCGDVGFGKTEVAIRAAFKAFVDEKQVAFLCPTTILSAQHARTFKERFKDFPVTIEVLNRFVSEKEQKDILKRVKEGKVDILIGTHRILSQDVKFKDLGLLIIDEEQRFGVEHKERIKEFKISIDVLSLSATPIPRTLQMSLIGLRSLSQLNTPPSNRVPVMTYIIEQNPETTFDIIRKELRRDGQVFYLHNNIQEIYTTATQIQTHVEGVNVAVVHGQMDRHEIEDVMLDFIDKKINVLVCTTIIETGIDIPNANTILVENAHKFGLAQLYQIRGRVGRSDRLAYAYFMVPSKKSLSEVATKRLQAIKEFTQLGSGYKIAMRDLTIRGAGEILGGNQSGFIDTIGIDLYIDLLKEAIALRQGKEGTPETETVARHLPVDGYVPENFTSDDGETLDLYQHINSIQSVSALRAFQEQIADQYGKLPQAIILLLEKKRLEILLQDERIKSFKERTTRVDLVFTEEFSDRVDGIHLFEMISERSREIKIKYVNQCISITMKLYPDWLEDLLYILDNIKEKD